MVTQELLAQELLAWLLVELTPHPFHISPSSALSRLDCAIIGQLYHGIHDSRCN